MKKAAIIFGITATLLISNLACADYYRWTDEHGVPRYSSTPPTGIKAEKIKSSGNIAGDYDPNAEANKLKGGQQEQAKLQDHAKAVEDKQKQQAEELEAKCKAAAQQQQTLTEKHRIRVKKADGTEDWLSEEDRQAKIQEMDNFIKASCQNKP